MAVLPKTQPPRSSDVPFDGLLRRALHRDDLEVTGCRALATDVYHLTLTTGRPASVVLKRLDPAAAHRDRLLVRRWLPAVGLTNAGPPLLATVGDEARDATWSVYEWLDGGTRLPPDPDELDRLVDVVASMHVRFAGHPMLAEVRHHGAHLGHGAYVGQLDDAMLALTEAGSDPVIRAYLAGTLLADLERAVRDAREEAPALLTMLNEVGGPDTLLHGDLWPRNVMVGPGWLRLIDWDRLGVGPAIYDLSTLLLRVPPGARQRVLDRYLAYVVPAGWPVPTVDEVVHLSTAFERARLATLISWRVLDLLHTPNGRTPDRRMPGGPIVSWAAEQLRSIRTWWHQVDPRPEVEEVRLN